MIRNLSRPLVAAALMLCSSSAFLLGTSVSSAQPTAPAELPTFTILVNEDSRGFDLRTAAQGSAEYWGAFAAYGQQLAAAGAMAGGSAVEPPALGRAVMVRNGKTISTPLEIPPGQTRVGGYFIIRAKNLDEAIALAAKCPAALNTSVEVRPNVVMNPPQ